jgi:hypothetical protein
VHVRFRTGLQELRQKLYLEPRRFSAQSHIWRLLPAISGPFVALCGEKPRRGIRDHGSGGAKMAG